ncbi:hypothetical protein PPYR_07365 [Photinus pyralis]|uniref:Uncharacterized protein n=2 Tax=Photinus pyralis TaxID=7054 RepID=A0A5N4AQ49_PHOPY|nr:uncharacterized protein LOC116169740 [Photinus pyralis]KAB0799485.1 hypothetical protein PPYR_07365 [Photinus pyralis]
MISSLTILAGLFCIGESGLITHHGSTDDQHSSKATSYQSFHMEHFHAVPTYIKKEYIHLLDHPVSVGKTASNVEVHHGAAHDHGYAIAENHDTPLENTAGDHLANGISSGGDHQYQSYESQSEAASAEESPQFGHSYGHEDVGQQSSNTGGHYQPTMYVLQYQNENSDGHEQAN